MPDQRRAAGQADQTATVGPAGQKALVRPVEEDAAGLADISLVLFQRDAVLGLQQAVKAAVLVRPGKGVGHFGRWGAGPGGVDKGEQRIKAHGFNQAKRIFKLRLRLAGETDDDIGGEDNLRHFLRP